MPADHSPLNIALAATELGVGGAERCLMHLALGLHARGHHVEVYSLSSPPAAGRDGLVNELQAAEIPTHFLHLKSSWQYWSGVRQLRQMLLKQRPDVLQSFLFHANVLAVSAASRASVPTIFQGVRVADPTYWRQQLEGYWRRRVQGVVCVSESVRAFVEQQRLSCPLTVIPNGIDVSRFQDVSSADLSDSGIAPTRRLMTFIGRLHPQKGLDQLLPHLADTFAALPSHDLLVVGDGPANAALQQQVRELQLTQRIHFVGYRQDIPQVLAASDLLILPSRYEGMPNVVMEAMAAAKPIVCTRVHGIEELLGELTSEQVRDDGEASFAKQITRLLQAPAQAEQLGQANLARIAEHFSLAAMTDASEQLYRMPGHDSTPG